MVTDVVHRALSAVLALALLVGGLVVAAEIVVAGLGRPPWLVAHDRWTSWAASVTWADGDARLAFGALFLGGLVLLALALGRRRPVSLPLAAAGGGVGADLDRRTVERWLVHRVARVDGVTSAEAKVGRNAVRIRTSSMGPDADAMSRQVHEAVGRDLQELALDRPVRIKVDVRQRRVS